MVSDVAVASSLGRVGPHERTLLTSPRRPIVLLDDRRSGEIAEDVTPGRTCIGIMLPYTALHHLLFREVEGIPLVMTSGNHPDEPIAYREDAVERLVGMADLFLTHDREIQVRCDDSVTRVVGGIELPVRRSRGYAPEAIPLPFACPRPILAVGGQLKVTFALGRDRSAFPGHHMGDLDRYEAYRVYETDVAHYQQLFALAPMALAHDLHPDYATTRYAIRRAEAEGIPTVAVQHHHAHMASCMAENGLAGPVIGITFDGAGFGTDGAIWGGEFLVGDYRGFRRGAHFRYVGMLGGEVAIRQPWRMAASHLIDAGICMGGFLIGAGVEDIRIIQRMLKGRINSPYTSSVGRLFDAVAALAGVRARVAYEGQAAAELECLAGGLAPDRAYPYDLGPIRPPDAASSPLIIDTRPLIRTVAAEAGHGVPAARIARRFHSTIVDLIAEVCGRLRRSKGVEEVVFSGGVFLNALLTSEASERLSGDGFRVHRHRLVPPNDGGLSLGQLAVAAATLAD